MTDPFEAYARFYDLDVGQVDDDLWMIREFAARTGSPILELACGTGRVLLPLAREGYSVTGVDVSPAMLALARQKLAAEGLLSRVSLVEQDMRYLDLEGRFNLALVALNSFSHLLTLEDQIASLQRIYEHLEPGGLLLLDLFNPDLERLLDFRGHLVLDMMMTDPERDRRLLKFRTLFPFRMRYLFRHELELLLRYAGYQLEAIYGSYELDEFDGASDRLLAIARRPS
jgi:SAM-dependent methyltransferase